MMLECRKSNTVGYEPETVHLFDMFPQTHHVEPVAILQQG